MCLKSILGSGVRIGGWTETSTSITNFRYDHKNLLQETDRSGDLTKQYTRTDEEYGSLISEYDAVNEGLGTGEFYHQFDAQYAANAMLDDTGTVVQKFRFQAFGLPAPGGSFQSWTGLTTDQWSTLSTDGWASLQVSSNAAPGAGCLCRPMSRAH